MIGPSTTMGTRIASSGATGTFGIVSTSATTNTIVKRPPTAMMLMASTPAKKPSSRSKCSPHVGQSSTMFR